MMAITDFRIEIERWITRRKIRNTKNKDAARMTKAVIQAEVQSKKLNRRLWVLKLSMGDYAVVTKQQVRAFFTKMGMPVNYCQLNEYIVHITKKTNE